ncbi:MAG TPA: response regulator [Tepidisphaeraceae bacterium]|jgi:FixJ family two-component response regulator|nr:response regulator [Tepidisphaeraceae bacterium]
MNDFDSTVVIVDDDPSVVKAVVRLLDSAGLKAASFTTPGEFLAAYDADQTGCLVLDLTMPNLSGLDLQGLLLQAGCAPPIIFLTGTADIPTSVKAMKLGAVDFLTKPVEDATLLSAIERALTDERAARARRRELIGIGARLQRLTPREREVFEHVVSGRLNKQIAADLGIAEKTIKVHRARVMEKLQVDSLAALVHLGERMGIRGSPSH